MKINQKLILKCRTGANIAVLILIAVFMFVAWYRELPRPHSDEGPKHQTTGV